MPGPPEPTSPHCPSASNRCLSPTCQLHPRDFIPPSFRCLPTPMTSITEPTALTNPIGSMPTRQPLDRWPCGLCSLLSVNASSQVLSSQVKRGEVAVQHPAWYRGGLQGMVPCYDAPLLPAKSAFRGQWPAHRAQESFPFPMQLPGVALPTCFS